MPRLKIIWKARFGAAAAMFPLLLGGCPDVRAGFVDAFESATLAIVSDQSSSGPQGVFERGILGTIVRVFYDQLRDPATP